MAFLSLALVSGAVLETSPAINIRNRCVSRNSRISVTRNCEENISSTSAISANGRQYFTGSKHFFTKGKAPMSARFDLDVQRSLMFVESSAEFTEPDCAVPETIRPEFVADTANVARTSIVPGGVRKSSNDLYPFDGDVDWNRFDVIVVGVGAAGLYSALSLPSHLRIAVVTKEGVDSTCSSIWAQGGIAAVTDVDPLDSIELHEDDTIAAGDGLCDPDAVRFLVSKGRECIDSLLRLGTSFDKHGDDLALTLEAAHSRARILHVGDATGRELVRSLKEQVLARPNIRVIDHAVVLDVALDEQDSCRGAMLFHEGKLVFAPARAVIVAAGGGGQVYYPTSNPTAITGDSAAIGWRAGALLRDLEFVQFHPTTFRREGAPTTLVTEAVRGEGAHIVDEQGRRFMFDYHAAGELAPRSTVSRSIFLHLQTTGASCVYLDLRHLPRDKVKHRFPNLIEFCRTWGVDVHSQRIPVAPAAHYWMGGVFTDLNGQTTVRGLYAVGEAASTGVHGANRLASNSLLECLVFASQLWKLQLNPDHPPRPTRTSRDHPASAQRIDASIAHALHDLPQQRDVVQRLRHEVPRLMGEFAGICRDGSRMEAALQELQEWRTQLFSLPMSCLLASLLADPELSEVALPVSLEDIRTWSDTRNLLDVAQLILQSAVFRTESRGAHYRADYPHSDVNWEAHTLVHRDSIWRAKIGDGQVVRPANAPIIAS